MRTLSLRIFEIVPGRIYQSPLLNDWKPIADKGIWTILDMEGGLDNVIPRPPPDKLTYVCHPIEDGSLPNMDTMHILARMASDLSINGEKILTHCAGGINRASLMNGLIMHYLFPDMSGQEIVDTIQRNRPGALTNSDFRNYLINLESRR